MNKNEIVILSLKTIGLLSLLFLITHVVRIFFTMISLIERGITHEIIIGFLFSTTQLVLLSSMTYFLIFKSEKIMNMIYKDNVNLESKPITNNELQVLAFSVIGLWLIAVSIPKVISHSIGKFFVSIPELNKRSSIYIIQDSLKLGIGFYLFLGSSGLVKIWRRINNQNKSLGYIDMK